jgi:GMP synthase-like glutamine amidotransferase
MMNKVANKVLTMGYVPFGTGSGPECFDVHYPKSVDVSKGWKDCDAIVIWGGEDIATGLYGEKPNGAHSNESLSRRDIVELAACKHAIDAGIPIVGVCRGAQLVCALAGGRLIQDVTGHAGYNHSMETDDGRILTTNSLHHQMMYPYDVEHKLIAWATPKRSMHYHSDNPDAMKKMSDLPEPEVVWFPKIKALAIQGHPEFRSCGQPFIDYCNELVAQYVL